MNSVKCTSQNVHHMNFSQRLTGYNEFDRLFNIMTNAWAMIGFFMLLFLSFAFIDQPLTLAAYTFGWSQKFHWIEWLTHLGSGAGNILVIGLFALSCRFIFKNAMWERRAWFLWLCVVIPNSVCLVLKIWLGRARPELLLSMDLYGFYGLHKNSLFWSFPSGHTTTIMGLMFGLGALFPRYLYGFIFFGSIIICSRVLLLQHYLSDVLVASYLALVEIGVLHYIFRKYSFFGKPNI